MKKIVIEISVLLGVLFILSFFIFPEPNKNYTGVDDGVLHGILLIPNWIISLFDESRQIKATTYDSWYNYAWWSSSIGIFIDLIYLSIKEYKKTK